MATVRFLLLFLVKIAIDVSFVNSKPVTVGVGVSTLSSPFDSSPHDKDLIQLEDQEVHRLALRNKSNLWPGGVIPYIIKEEYSKEVQNVILRAMKEIEDDVSTNNSKCIQFVPRTNEENYLAIRRGVGCHTYIGYWANGVHYSTISTGCEKKGIIMHELIHSLGFYHEQDRYDRDNYVTINETNIEGGTASRNFKMKSDEETDTLGTPYDFGSIMHYEPYNFAKDLQYPTITPKPGLATDINMGQRFGLSKWDVIDIQRLYGCPEDASHIRSVVSSDNVLFWCNFASGPCNLQQSVDAVDTRLKDSTGDQKNKVSWVVRSVPSHDGPIAGFSTGADPFLYASNGDAEIQLQGNSEEATTAAVLEHSQNSNSSVEMGGDSNPPLIPSETSRAQPHNPSVASIFTPYLDFDDDTRQICIDFKVFQPTKTSYLSVYLTGPNSPRHQIVSYKNKFRVGWVPIPYTVTIPKGPQLRLEFEAVLTGSSVSLDDVLVYKGRCE